MNSESQILFCAILTAPMFQTYNQRRFWISIRFPSSAHTCWVYRRLKHEKKLNAKKNWRLSSAAERHETWESLKVKVTKWKWNWLLIADAIIDRVLFYFRRLFWSNRKQKRDMHVRMGSSQRLWKMSVTLDKVSEKWTFESLRNTLSRPDELTLVEEWWCWPA